MRVTLLVLLLAIPWTCAGSGWVAFIAPDIAQGRALYEDFRRLAGPDLAASGLELRYVPVGNAPDGPEVEEPIMRAIAERPRVILAAAERVAAYAKKHTSRIPVIFGSAVHPVRAGLVASMSRPGGNLTGFTFDVDIERKQIELLREIAPKARVIGVLNDGTWFPKRLPPEQIDRLQEESGVLLRILTGAEPGDMARIVRSREGRAVDAWLVPVHNLTGTARDEVVRAINDVAKPAVYGRSFFVEAGGLASYQEVLDAPMAIWAEMFRMIMKGTPPGEIPIRRPKDFILAINADQARRQGVVLKPSLLRRADRVVGGPAH